jgi:hypothetical protein
MGQVLSTAIFVAYLTGLFLLREKHRLNTLIPLQKHPDRNELIANCHK